MAKIEITKASVDKIISDLQAEKNNIGTFMTKLDTELGDVNNAWSGKDATKYTKIMKNDYKRVLKELNDSYQSYIDFLGNVYNEYKKVDDKYVAEKIEV